MKFLGCDNLHREAMAIERDLHELLYCHDCVIVPEWGGFLTHYRSARLDEARSLVHPPGKDISFNKSLVRNDGLLADRLAKREGIAFDVASARIDAEVDGWRRVLHSDGRLELPHIGIFYHDAEHNLQFDPDRRSDHLKDGFGLRPVSAVPVEQPRSIPVIPISKAATISGEQPMDRRVPYAWIAAAVTAVLFGAGAWFLNTQGDRIHWDEIAAVFAPAERTYDPTTIPSPRTVANAGLFSLPEGPDGVRTLPLGEGDSVLLTVDLGTPSVEPAAPDTTHVAMPVTEGASTSSIKRSRFHIIGGCFAQPENAERFLAELRTKGYNAVRLSEYGELHPVAYGSYSERNAALEALANVRSSGSHQAWLLVR
jgi:cell division septation protein DedD